MTRRDHHRKISPKINPGRRPMLEITVQAGQTWQNPILCGDPDGRVRLVRTTGLVYGIRKGREVWVTGHRVDPAITIGAFEHVADAPAVEPVRPVVTEPVPVPGQIAFVVMFCSGCSTSWRDPIDDPKCRCTNSDREASWLALRSDYVDAPGTEPEEGTDDADE